MTIDEYRKLFPTENVWRVAPIKQNGETSLIVDGMLLFDDCSAANLAGPFDGNYGYFSITDRTDIAGWKLFTEQELRQQYRLSIYSIPNYYRYGFNSDVSSEGHLQRRLRVLSKKDLELWERNQREFAIDCPTAEKPFVLYICGNDDSSWSKFFSTAHDAKLELNLLEYYQPLSWDIITERKFIFTN